ncbi:MAG: phospholipid-binding protein MlaC [Methylophilaceae bacterium]
MKLATLLTAASLLAATQLAVAGDVIAPDVMVKSTANEVLEIVRKDKDIQAGDTQKIVAITQEKIVPHFNFERMSRMVLGRAWVKASDEQKDKFQTEFRNLLVRTYSSALAKYRNQVIEYKPLRAAAGDTEVVVRTQIVQPGGPPIPIDYSMEKKDDAWKVYDVKIDGISMVTNYKGQFAPDLRQGSLDVVIQKLVDKNQQLLAKRQEKS